MVDLSVQYLGMKLKNPLVIASSPLGDNIKKIQELEKKGAAAVVLPSFFEEQESQKEFSYSLLYEENGYSKYLDYYREVLKNKLMPDEYMEYILKLKNTVIMK